MMHHPFAIGTFPLAVVLAAAMVAAVSDLRSFRVPNALTFPLAVAGLTFQAIDPRGQGGLVGLLGLALGLASLVVPYAMGGMGAGDVKLMAGVGAWLGPAPTLQVVLVAALAAGAYSMALVVLARGLPELRQRFERMWVELVVLGQRPGVDGRLGAEMARPGRRRRLVPFAVMIIVGAASVAFGPLMS